MPTTPAGGFDSQLSVRTVDPTTWSLIFPLVWRGTKGDVVEVPVGFVTDFATVPRFLVWKTRPYGPYTRAAVLHDYLIEHRINAVEDRITSRDVDGIFRVAMRDLGTPWLVRWQMWAAVRLAACFNSRRAYGRDFWKDAPKVFGMLLISAPFTLPGAIGTLISLTISWPFDRLQRPARARAHA